MAIQEKEHYVLTTCMCLLFETWDPHMFAAERIRRNQFCLIHSLAHACSQQCGDECIRMNRKKNFKINSCSTQIHTHMHRTHTSAQTQLHAERPKHKMN